MTGTAPTRLAPADAARSIVSSLDSVPLERMPLIEAAGRILGERITSPIDVPPWDNAAMDGYAARAPDVRPGAELRIVQHISAGKFPSAALGPGECARVFTGAPVPEDCDTVIRQEDVTLTAADHVRIDDDRDRATNVRRRGEDIARGSLVFEPGIELGAAQIGVIASLAIETVAAHRSPRVALLTTGDELGGLDQADAILRGEKIASSNTYTMLAMTRAAGGEPLDLGIARDDPADLRSRLEGGATMADLIVTSGAMSVGAHDHLRTVMSEEENGLAFWRVRMRPGGPVGFGRFHGIPWIGLPGNPVSTMVTFETFVRPAIRRLAGHRWLFRRAIPVRVGERITTNARLTHFLRVRIDLEGEAVTAHLTGPQSSGILSSMAKADALLIVPEDRQAIAEGAILPAIMLCETLHLAEPPF
jgi:molybdopterin molybdotransferase